MSVWHSDGSNVSTLEKKTLKNYQVLEDLNDGILRIYAVIRLLVHQKIPYIAILTHLENHPEAVDLYFMNWNLNRLSRVDICHQLIGNPIDDRFIRRIVTCDEK